MYLKVIKISLTYVNNYVIKENCSKGLMGYKAIK